MSNETDELTMKKQDADRALAGGARTTLSALIRGREKAPPADCGAAGRAGAEQMTHDKYAALRQALDAAHEQAAEGKGRERHARDGQDFTSQPIMAITRMVGIGYPCGQAMKKLQEAVGMAERRQYEAAQREMLGAINYAAAAWIRAKEMGQLGDGDQPMAQDVRTEVHDERRRKK